MDFPNARTELLDLAARFRQACADRNTDALYEMCTTDPSMVVFDVDGHAYRGARHWTSRPWPADPAPDGEPACTTLGTTGWVVFDDRTTLVTTWEGGTWRIAHVHRSRASTAPRPGDI